MERAEFQRLAVEQIDAVYRMALQLCRNPEQAEDLVQEVYLRALQRGVPERYEDRRGAGKEGDGVRAWLFTIAHHAFYSRLRRQKLAPGAVPEFFEEESSERLPDEAPPAWDLASLDWEQVDERLKKAIDDLKPEYREVLLFWGVEGLKYREIAEIVGVPIGTVMSRLHRARKLVADAIGEAGLEGPGGLGKRIDEGGIARGGSADDTNRNDDSGIGPHLDTNHADSKPLPRVKIEPGARREPRR